MATPDTFSIVSQVTFRMRVQHVNQLKEVRSPQFLVQGIPWRVHVAKTIEEAEQFLAVFLHCESNENPPGWTQPATATFKLLSFNGNSSAKEYQLEPHVFDFINNVSGCTTIRWTDLLDASNHFVKDDAINLEVSVDVADSFDDNQCELTFEGVDNCCEKGRFGTFRLTVNNIKNLMAIRSPQFMLRNMPWCLTLFKHASYLGLRLDARNSSDEAIYNVSATAQIISTNAHMQTQQKKEAPRVRRRDGLVMERLMPWDDVIMPQNGFINNDSITVEIEINAEKQQHMESGRVGLRKRKSSTEPAPIKAPRMECPICMDPIESQDVSFTPCGHIFCTPCISDSIRERKACPTCNVRVTAKQVKPLHLPIVTHHRSE